MQTTEKLKLYEKVAAVRFSTTAIVNEIAGVAEIIPAGEVIHIDLTAPLIGGMRQVDWKGILFGVFDRDLQERADRPKLQAKRTTIGAKN